MPMSKFTTLIAVGLMLVPVQLFAQGVGGSPPPPKPGDRAMPNGAVGGSALPSKPGVASGTTGSVGQSYAPANPGMLPSPTGSPNSTTGR